ncbi:O-antigen ligase domain-containing protein (plasmid) [Azospirillum argentinense]|uniref:O-antigen ligase domain-containing protein n=1 Tax=Azospirillum argentinense TaxID=2970906 RepID=A0A4D8PNX6_9PROT|nr:O-antigen ligase domain-containing protein [Azospirillum argentinense]
MIQECPSKDDLTPEESLIRFCLIYTWPFYFIGALYLLAPIVGWTLFIFLIARMYVQTPDRPPHRRAIIPIGVWVWIAGMLTMELALIIAHVDFSLGIPMMVKSSIGWAKGWALLAIFPAIGAGLQIRPAVIYRATCVISLHVLILMPLLFFAYVAHLPSQLYVSPLQIVGGPGPEFFSVTLYNIDATTGGPRWRFFTPWAPAAGFVANIYFIFSLQEKNKAWRWIGIIGWTLVAILSKSRLALIVLIFSWPITLVLSNMRRPAVAFSGAGAIAFAGLVGNVVMEAYSSAMETFTAARPESSRVRATLGRIAVNRWQSEAPIWGHGIVERGPHLVEYMPIGSHHSWYGLLYVKGAVGFAALAIPLIYSLICFLEKSQNSSLSRVALCIIMILIFYTFAENLEILSYLIWPSLVIVGAAIRESRKTSLQ